MTCFLFILLFPLHPGRYVNDNDTRLRHFFVLLGLGQFMGYISNQRGDYPVLGT